MGPKTILVCLTTPEHAATLMKLAVPLARKYDAHLIGLHTVEALMVYPGIALHVPDPVFAQFNESQRNQAADIEKVFQEHTKNEDFVSEWRLVQTESITAAERMIESARGADLVIMSHEDREWDRADQSQAQDRVIRESGRPVIVVPLDYDGPEIGQSILMGWSDTREASRAAHDLLSVANEGAALCLLRVGAAVPDEMTDHRTNDVAEMLGRHGLKVKVMHRDKDGKTVAEVLNHEAFEQGADLIVTGAFGHSRTYDFVIGAATQDLLRNAKYPVLFSK